mmetsp:Transcript_26347/g.72407  ORF Transcript_26347/g.72407 Transcript_26347/m.72407 type:complete len:211 (+) Transcript_26347:79-711(+)
MSQKVNSMLTISGPPLFLSFFFFFFFLVLFFCFVLVWCFDFASGLVVDCLAPCFCFLAGGFIGSSSSSSSSSLPPMEYLVDCSWDSGRQKLSLLAGSSRGDGAVFDVGEQEVTPLHYLRGGHRGVIRAWSSNPVRSSFLTAGEDARLCEWTIATPGSCASDHGHPAANATATANKNQIIVAKRKREGGPVAGSGGGKLRKPRSRMSSAPY